VTLYFLKFGAPTKVQMATYSPGPTTFQAWLADPVFATYAVCAVILTFKMMVASFNVTRLRLRHRAFKYEEDFPKGMPAEKKKELRSKGLENPSITQAYGLHTNDMENIYVFYTIGLLFAITSPPVHYGQILLCLYTGARLLHMVFYLARLQPWRALSYLTHIVAQVLMLVHITRVAIDHVQPHLPF